MELPLPTLHWERRAPNWIVAAVSGFAAGAVLMVLDLIWSSLVDTGGPWRTSHMIAPIFFGTDITQQTTFHFSGQVVAVSLIVHYALGTVFGLILAAVMAPLHLDATALRALVTGALFGLILYFLNFFGLVQWFPWLAELRGWPTIGAHLVFGMVAALLYWRLEGGGASET
jgi:hypothetical protein